MIIRSQDKKKIINFSQVSDLIVLRDSRIEKWEICACYPYFADSDCGFATVATYSTEEKAIKVLDMIQEAYCRMRASDCMTSGSMDNLVGFAEEKKATIIDGVRAVYVFQMPQDSEV